MLALSKVENKIPWMHAVMKYVLQAYGYVAVILETRFHNFYKIKKYIMFSLRIGCPLPLTKIPGARSINFLQSENLIVRSLICIILKGILSVSPI
jgi:hypothetical protein